MPTEYRAKVFKSGNAVALRLPKPLGITEGTEMLVREESGKFSFEPVDRPNRKLNVQKFWGCAAGSGLHLIEPKDRVIEHRVLQWEGPDRLSRLERDE